MKEHLFSEFQSVSEKDWLGKVEKDLKGKPIDGLNWQWSDMEYSPFFHRDGSDNSNPPLKKGNQWLINEDLYISDEKSANSRAINALEGGATCLSFYAENLNEIKLSLLLKDIQLEWIQTQFYSSQELNKAFSNQINSLIKQNSFDPSKIRIASNQTFKSTEVKTYPIIQAPTASIEGDTEALRLIQKNSHTQGIITIKLTDHYYGNICRIRAIKKTLKTLNKDTNVFLQAEINPNNEAKDVNYRFIQSNAQAMAAVIGGADILNVKSENAEPFQNRINRNINHLLELESYMARVGDPSAGSYFLEKMTQDIYQTISKELQ